MELTVPDCAVVSNHTKLFAGIVASLKLVTTLPVDTLVVVVPLVTTSFPAALLSVECLIVHVTDGVDEPTRTAAILVIVIATGVKNIEMSSVAVGVSTATDLENVLLDCKI